MNLLPWMSTNVPLSSLTTFRIGGPARWLARPGSTEEVIETVRWAAQHGVPALALGGGSNILVSDAGVEAVVIQLGQGSTGSIRHDTEQPHRWRAGAGAGLQSLLLTMAKAGAAGLAWLGGIPGTVGGAVRMNCGDTTRGIGNSVESVEIVTMDGELRVLDQDQCGFGYRRSSLDTVIVTAVNLVAVPDIQPDAAYTAIKQSGSAKAIKQPLGARSAGCFFTNPGEHSAGRLIDVAGCKGWKEGMAEVSSVHANFIINRDSATCNEVARLAVRVRRAVWEHHRIFLTPEVELWGRQDALAMLRQERPIHVDN